MKVAFCSIATFASIFLVACSSSLKVTSDYDKKADFSKFKTFAIDTSRVTQRVISPNVTRMFNALKSEMTKKGFTENNANPDLRVGIVAIIKDTHSTSANADYAYGGVYRPWVWGGEGMGVSAYSTYDVQSYRNGSLIIDVSDPGTKKLLWEGIGNTQVDRPLKDPDTLIPQVVGSIMAKFPPGKK